MICLFLIILTKGMFYRNSLRTLTIPTTTACFCDELVISYYTLAMLVVVPQNTLTWYNMAVLKLLHLAPDAPAPPLNLLDIRPHKV